ncbi:MAG: ABC transporter permease subunit, partial [Planctomycetota bacterium]
EPMVMMLVAAWTIVRGSDVVSGEINRGTMEIVLSQPISRKQVFLQHAILTTLGLLVLVLLIWLAMSLAVLNTVIEEATFPVLKIPLTSYEIPITFFGPQTETVAMSDRVSPLQYLPGIINLFCFGMFMTGLSMMFSSWDRFRWRTLGIVVGIYFVQAMLKVGSLASEKFQWLQYFTYFSLYKPALSIEIGDTRPEELISLFRYDETGELLGLGPIGFNLLLVLFTMGFLAFGLRVFSKRDLPAPI